MLGSRSPPRGNGGFSSGGRGNKLDRPADATGVLVGGERLEHFEALNQIGGNRVQLDVADISFRRRQIHAVDGDVAEARLGATDLHVLALAFVAFEGNAGDAADGVGDIGIGEAGDDSFGQDLHDVVRGALNVDTFPFTLDAFRAHYDLIALRSNL